MGIYIKSNTTTIVAREEYYIKSPRTLKVLCFLWIFSEFNTYAIKLFSSFEGL